MTWYTKNGKPIRKPDGIATDKRCCCPEGLCCCPQFTDPEIPPATLTGTLRSADPCVEGVTFTLTSVGSADCVRYKIINQRINDDDSCSGDQPINVTFDVYCNGGGADGFVLELVGGTSGCGVDPVLVNAEEDATCDPLFVEFLGISITDINPPGCPSNPIFDLEISP